jgi:release factor glutamine methyltransferase
VSIKEALNLAHEKFDCKASLKLDFELLLSFLMQVSREYLFAFSEREISEGIIEKFFILCERRSSGEPLAYLIGKKEFFGLDFLVNGDVLIPRPETEELVMKILAFANDRNLEDFQILELGTGSGAISISLAKNLHKAQIVATDISRKALSVASSNATFHEVSGRIEFVESDLLDFLNSDALQNFMPQLVVANLPYIGTVENSFVSKETFDYEPHLALFAGSDGLDLYRKLFAQICDFALKPELILGEIGLSQGSALQSLAQEFFIGYEVLIKQDLAGFDRYFLISKR